MSAEKDHSDDHKVVRYGAYYKELGRKLCVVLCDIKNPDATTIKGEAVAEALCDYPETPGTNACLQCEVYKTKQKECKVTGEPDNLYGDVPREQALRDAQEIIDAGGSVFFKFTCEHCGQRLFMEPTNTIYDQCTCDKCGKTTIIKRVGFAAQLGWR